MKMIIDFVDAVADTGSSAAAVYKVKSCNRSVDFCFEFFKSFADRCNKFVKMKMIINGNFNREDIENG